MFRIKGYRKQERKEGNIVNVNETVCDISTTLPLVLDI